MKEKLTVRDGLVVHIHFKMIDEDGEVLDSTEEDGPLPYLHGADNIVPGLEKALEGKSVGDRIKVVVPPELGYGTHNGMPPQSVPRDAFPEDMDLEPGEELVAEDEDGSESLVWIVDVDGDEVIVDTNHPLCDETLTFEAEVLAIRPATADEIEHGHPHDGDDHDH